MILAALLSIIVIFISYGIFWVHRQHQVFKKRNIKHKKPMFLFGNTFDEFFGRRHQSELVNDIYNAFPEEDVVGHYQLFNPAFVIRNPDFVNEVLVRDFTDFHDRIKSGEAEITDANDANLFFLSGNTWRALRYKFTPLFTSGKLKYMYHSIADCAKTLQDILDKKDGQEVEMAETMGLFAMDVIGSAAFGVEPNLQENPTSEFRENAKDALEANFITILRMFTDFLFPKIARALNFRGFVRPSVLKYFSDMITSSLKYRQEKGFVRNDLVQMMLQLKEKGKIEMQLHDPGDDYLIMDKTNEIFELEMTDDVLVGGALTFLFAGFHATAMALTYALFELAQNPEVVERLREEIKQSVKGGLPTYEELKNMTYLEMVVKESLRMHSPAPSLVRLCTKDHTFSNGLELKKGEILFIPSGAIQMDPAHWPEPHVFNPERFHPDTPPRPGTYLPFGEGPRICIAMRFAMLEVKLALAILIRNYNFELSEKTKLPLKPKPRAFLLSPEGGITFRVTKVK